MKFIMAIFLLVALVFSYSQVKDKEDKYGIELIENDFLKYANQLKINSLEREVITSFNIYDEEMYKFVYIDAEELAEFSFDFFLPQLKEILEKRDIALSVETAEDYKDTHNIIINGEIINLYSNQELENMTFWYSASTNFFREINKVLLAENVNEKFYLLYAGNDLSVLLLTEKQFEIIKNKYRNQPKDIPYLP